MRRASVLARSAMLCLALLGCGPAATPAYTAKARASSAASESVPRYDSAPLDGAVRGDAADDDLETALRKACAGQHLALDGRLAMLGEALAQGSHGAREAPSYARVSHEARRAGLVEPTPEVWLASGPSTRALTSALTAQVRTAAGRGHLTHCGVGAVREGGGVVVALVLSGRFVSFAEPIPQKVERGGAVTLRGTLAPGYREPTLAITSPAGSVSRKALGAARDVAEQLTLSDPGVYTVELLANGPQGITVVANFPIGVGVDPNRAPSDAEEVTEKSAEAVADHLFDAIAKERAARSLPPLRLDPRLTDVALAHGEDMLKHGFIAHTSETTGEAKDRVKRAGITATVVLENIGRGYSAQEIHLGLMESPGHRGNVLHPDARELGIGVVAEREGGRLAFIATEVFTRQAREIALEDAPRELLRAVGERRKKAKAPAIALDDALSRAAQAAARRYASGVERDEQRLLDQATREITGAPKGVRALAAALVLSDDVEQVWESPRLVDPALRRLGVGIARLNSSERHALVVVLLLGLGE